jgi:PKD repeat protein
MGHTAATFSEPEYLLHMLGGLETAAGMPGTQGCDPPNEVPTVLAAADPDTGQAPLTVRFSAAGSDADGDQLTYAWEFGDGQRSFRRNPTHVYLTPGQYTAKVTVTDGKGGSASATVAVNVTNPPGNVAPTVLAAADPASGRPPLTVRFSAAGSDPDGDALTYAWDFGDGGVAYGAQATHVYEERGTYTARVTVTDTKGATGTATVQVRVTRGGGVAGEMADQAGVRVARSYDAERVVDKGLRFSVSCEVFCRVTSTLRMRGGDEERLGRSTARRIGAGKSRQIVVKLDRRVRRNLLDAMGAADMSRLRATLTIRVTTADGTTTQRKAVVLKR